MNLEERIQKIKDDFSKQLDQLLEDNKTVGLENGRANKSTAFEVGKWYKKKDGGSCLVLVADFSSAYVKGVGFDWKGCWSSEYYGVEVNDYRPATNDEVKEALVKEAEKRGFKEGVEFKSVRSGAKYSIDKSLSYDPALDSLEVGLNGPAFYEKGRWAEIVKEKPVTIAGYEVKYNTDTVNVGCKIYGKSDIKCMLTYFKAFKIESFKIESHDIKTSELQTLLDNWK